jgi:hypothetical protein
VKKADALVRGIWDFVVGDDWQTAAGVVLALAVTALVSNSTSACWWILPVAAALILVTSVWRVVRNSAAATAGGHADAAATANETPNRERQ